MGKSDVLRPALGPDQKRLRDLWDEHIRDEFVERDADATLDTMVPDAYVNHIPVITGGVGRDQLRGLYSRHFIPRMPPATPVLHLDLRMTLSRYRPEATTTSLS